MLRYANCELLRILFRILVEILYKSFGYFYGLGLLDPNEITNFVFKLPILISRLQSTLLPTCQTLLKT